MSDTTGWRVEQDRHDHDWYVVDRHGDTRAGPFPTPLAGREWLEEWRALLAQRRDEVQRQEDARRLFTNAFMQQPGATLDNAEQAYYAHQRATGADHA